jgi:hypothetical protein
MVPIELLLPRARALSAGSRRRITPHQKTDPPSSFPLPTKKHPSQQQWRKKRMRRLKRKRRKMRQRSK